MLSKTAQYALRAVAYLARNGAGAPRPIPIHEIAAVLDVPRNYLSKVLHTLARAGVLGSTRGPHGGFWVAVAHDELTLADVIAPFDDLGGPNRCLLRDRRCDPATPCIAHHEWQGIAGLAHSFFATTTLAALVQSEAASGAPFPI